MKWILIVTVMHFCGENGCPFDNGSLARSQVRIVSTQIFKTETACLAAKKKLDPQPTNGTAIGYATDRQDVFCSQSTSGVNQPLNIDHYPLATLISDNPIPSAFVISDNRPEPVLRIEMDGRIFWREHEIKSDAELRKAVIDLIAFLRKGTTCSEPTSGVKP